MQNAPTIHGEWSQQIGRRQSLRRKWQKYAAFTLPRLCTQESFDEFSDEVSNDWQSVGAQALNHVVNKLMLALFAPSRPFMRLQADTAALQSLPEGVDQTMIDTAMAEAEQQATRQLDSIPKARSKLYLALQYLVATGNCVLYLPTEKGVPPRVYGPTSYTVRRTGDGRLHTLIIQECLAFNELDQSVQDTLRSAEGQRYNGDTKVKHYRRIALNARGGYDLKQAVDTHTLPADFDAAWPNDDKLPYRVLTWNLRDGCHYGTGLVEDYAADFAGLSLLSEAQIKGALMSSEYRWLVNPGGMTKVEDFEQSENGAAIPGTKDDIVLVNSNKSGDLQVVGQQVQDYIQRIGRGFLLGSAVTRDSERTTATEIRMQAQELETSFGGTYSNVAVDMQMPLAYWLLGNVGVKVRDKDIKVTILTGLDALSRSGDLDSLRAALQDAANLAQVRQFAPELNYRSILEAIFKGHNLSAGTYLKSEEQLAQEQQAQAQAQQQQAAAEAGAAAGAEAGATQGVA